MDMDMKRQALQELLSIVKGMKADRMKAKYGMADDSDPSADPADDAPDADDPDEGSPEEEAGESPAIEAAEGDAPQGMDTLMALKGDPEKLKALLGKK